MKARWLILVLVAGVGCRDSSPTSPAIYDVRLDVSVTRNLAGIPELKAVVVNHSTGAIKHAEGCSYWQHGMLVHFTSKARSVLYLRDPNAGPLCLDQDFSLPAGAILLGTSELSGTLYTYEGVAVAMSAGLYDATVRFDWREPGGSTWHSLEHTVSLTWPLPEGPSGQP